ncbi:MAG: aldehyde dehydrogenase [Clostridiales bacterium]|jgi:acyl-CoA reductase-like NAD-dependent aldehyde dehydrogenase|nr:aldehyde dehydrogenase [Clostridiales bacterium]MDN5300113.1 aldehyde dehydrogenase [Clostridiales bacterium]
MSTINPKEFFDPEYQLLINGEWTKGHEGKTIESRNPSNGEYLSKFIDATSEDVDAAVEAAKEAFKSWSEVTVQKRSALLLKIADLIDENTKRLALVETYDNGKPLRETETVDVPLASDHFRYFAGVIRAEEGSVALLDEDTWSLVIKEPVGVVGQIIPWNFPLLMAAWKLAPALAAGNTIVIHPSSSTSLSLLELGKLLNQVLPKGVVNIITGKGSVSGEYMLHHRGFDKLAFTGSTEVGYKVARAAADKLIPATLELGGKSANIFFDDMDIDQALEGAQLGILFNQGQVCCAGSRIFVQEGIYDQFMEGLKREFENVKVGMPWEEGVQMGAQVNQAQLDKILGYVKIGKEEGAEVLTGGVQLTEGVLGKGVFMAPTLMVNATNDMCIAQEEIFGPVATVIKFKTEEDVIKMANDSEYGLGGGVWTRDLNRALRVSKAIRTGRVWVNTYNQIPAGAPFGGYKKSGIGRETDKSILEAYTQTKNIFISTKEKKLGLY